MAYKVFTYEQTVVMREAIDLVAASLGPDGDNRRNEIAEVVLGLENYDDHDAAMLAQLTLAKMADRERKTA
jgi:hypothetical protein